MALRTVNMNVNVMYQDWQMECCGEPFGVGDEVAWPLRVDTSGWGAEWAAELTVLEGAVESLGGGPVVRVDGVTVPVPLPVGGRKKWPPRARLEGLLSVERHGGKWPDTVGRVRGIQVVTHTFADATRVPGERALRRVDRCPKWFKPQPPDARGRRREEVGALVSLEVTAPGVAAEPGGGA
ncbi:DUF6578 domain-containing protein [Streptomyces sp. NPDC052114]|uniref:DUF6578 domain-containing protein n=1 Tax=unclassified Streptomyces TaxID=2593676 RepID=UPI003443ED24